MIDLGNRQITAQGTVMLSMQAAVEALYAGSDLDGCVIDSIAEAQLYAHSNRLLDGDLLQLLTDANQVTHRDWYHSWTTPEPYASMDVLAHCLDKCHTDDQRERVCEEIIMFMDRDMLPVLRHLIWMVQELRTRGIVWGVGRGSSVSSYVLFLIGINRIDPMKFDLDVSEFLK
jgi:Bacterial DNA polymerase III alpha NTPase domain